MDSDGEDTNADLWHLTYKEWFEIKLRRIRNNDPRVKHLLWDDNSTNRDWEDIGRDISNNTFLKKLDFGTGALIRLDDEIFSSIFKGLTGSSSIVKLNLNNNEISGAGLRSIKSFVQNSTNLRDLDVSNNSIQTEGFNILMHELRGSPIDCLQCFDCGITTIEIESVPRNLRKLILDENNIQSEGFNILMQVLRGSSIERLDCNDCDITSIDLENVPTNLRELDVSNNNIQTEGFNNLWQALRGSPIERLDCDNCGITSIEIETVPNNLQLLGLSSNNIQSEGFNRLVRSLRNSNIRVLKCINCRIESIEIDTNSLPRILKELNLASNRINSNGCHEIAKLLQEGGITLEKLDLGLNLIGDEGVEILVDALKRNTSLKHLDLRGNRGISDNGWVLMLTLVNDMSSIKATLQSNHTLQIIQLGDMRGEIGSYVSNAIYVNEACSKCPEAAGREKVIQTQLHSQTRATLVAMQGVRSQSLYTEINPLHLPEVLSLVGNRHGQEELYVALKASIAEVMSTLNKKQFIQQRIAYQESIIAKHESIIAECRAKQRELREGLASMKEEQYALVEYRSSKRQRK